MESLPQNEYVARGRAAELNLILIIFILNSRSELHLSYCVHSGIYERRAETQLVSTL